MTVLSIQSSVAYGHVGNSAATFPLQRLGIEVSPVNTVHFSNHTGYGEWRGPVLAADDVADVLAGVEERGAFPHIDAVLSGYMGDVALGKVILDAVSRVRAVRGDAVYCFDPVLGDVGRGIFVRPGIPEFMRDVVLPVADIVTPNQFELDFLTGRTTESLDDALDAAAALRARGPGIVLVTSFVDSSDSVASGSAPPSLRTVSMLAASDDAAYRITTPLLPLSVNGGGDMTAALFLAHWLRTGDLAVALTLTTNSVYAVLAETHRQGAREIQIVAAQDAIATPPQEFHAERVA